ncbi:hypothetical protein J8273_7020 [Carpediemonas membranifera]|uniref:Uncharacterized protein n=1 Tax=Carpediemonas membranifera TaxID=201153 RepID=A0A8J6B136_9EUKA|nr:hypothetical protein J8273_7020 [Carpediemonas membranifera]|eukprot:KAG9390767.1 hypothetical protein J8273_7020 [Carpediemonas membranifera]
MNLVNSVIAASSQSLKDATQSLKHNLVHLKAQTLGVSQAYYAQVKGIPEKLHISSRPMAFPTALKVLALDPDTEYTKDEIRAAFNKHRELNDPANGGSHYLLAKIDTAFNAAMAGL